MSKTHLKVSVPSFWHSSMSKKEISNQTACGYVRDNVTTNEDLVNCKLCLKSKHMQHYHKINSTFKDSSGCY